MAAQNAHTIRANEAYTDRQRSRHNLSITVESPVQLFDLIDYFFNLCRIIPGVLPIRIELAYKMSNGHLRTWYQRQPELTK